MIRLLTKTESHRVLAPSDTAIIGGDLDLYRLTGDTSLIKVDPDLDPCWIEYRGLDGATMDRVTRDAGREPEEYRQLAMYRAACRHGIVACDLLGGNPGSRVDELPTDVVVYVGIWILGSSILDEDSKKSFGSQGSKIAGKADTPVSDVPDPVMPCDPHWDANATEPPLSE